MRFDFDVRQVKPGLIRNIDDLLNHPEIFDPVAAIRIDAFKVTEGRACIGQDRRAIDELRQWQAIFPGDRLVLSWLPTVLWLQGHYEKSLEELRRLSPPDSPYVRAVERGFADGGAEGADRAAGDYLASQPSPSALRVARAYSGAGEVDLAFQWLERAYEERRPQILHVVAYPEFEAIRSDPRYEDLLRRIGIFQEPEA